MSSRKTLEMKNICKFIDFRIFNEGGGDDMLRSLKCRTFTCNGVFVLCCIGTFTKIKDLSTSCTTDGTPPKTP